MKKFVVVLLGFSVMAFFSPWQIATAKNDNIVEKVFVHYPNPHARGTAPSCVATTNDQVADYGRAGWQMPAAGMNYAINYSTIPSSLNAATVQTAMSDSFGAWTAADGNQIFSYAGTTTVKGARRDGVNALLWKRINGSALAITYVWYNSSTRQLVEADTVFNKLYAWSYTDSSLGDCAGPAGTYDIQNIGTHEFGHWVGLDDLYNSVDKDLTMYGYGNTAELKKDSLGVGDIAGTLAISP